MSNILTFPHSLSQTLLVVFNTACRKYRLTVWFNSHRKKTSKMRYGDWYNSDQKWIESNCAWWRLIWSNNIWIESTKPTNDWIDSWWYDSSIQESIQNPQANKENGINISWYNSQWCELNQLAENNLEHEKWSFLQTNDTQDIKGP